MKIEMGESLFYSWLRHVKECQIVQTNWKVSTKWTFNNVPEIEQMYREIDLYFQSNYNYKIFKQNTSLQQVIKQGESDALGISIDGENLSFYAVDVAFHENGLNYGSKSETVCKVIAKCVRTVFCLYGYMGAKRGDIIFASPKIDRSIIIELLPHIEYLKNYFRFKGFDFDVRVICNDEFDDRILKPILLISDSIADTSELFMRAYQMYEMFAKERHKTRCVTDAKTVQIDNNDAYAELKIGKIVNVVVRDVLESGKVSDEEIEKMKTLEYSKNTFHITYPLLVSDDVYFDKVRYYSKPIMVRGKEYYLCSQWYELPNNNDRPYVIQWIEKHN